MTHESCAISHVLGLLSINPRIIKSRRQYQTISLAEVKAARDNSKFYLFDIREPNELIGGKIHAINWAHLQPRNDSMTL